MWKVNIACTLKWRVASIRITLLGVAHLIWEKHFRCGTCIDGRFSFEAVKGKKTDMWVL